MTAQDNRIRKELKKKGLEDMIPRFDRICAEMEEFMIELRRRES